MTPELELKIYKNYRAMMVKRRKTMHVHLNASQWRQRALQACVDRYRVPFREVKRIIAEQEELNAQSTIPLTERELENAQVVEELFALISEIEQQETGRVTPFICRAQAKNLASCNYRLHVPVSHRMNDFVSESLFDILTLTESLNTEGEVRVSLALRTRDALIQAGCSRYYTSLDEQESPLDALSSDGQ